MASYELNAFDRFDTISVVGAIEQQSPHLLNIGFWLRDPNQFITWPKRLLRILVKTFMEQHLF